MKIRLSLTLVSAIILSAVFYMILSSKKNQQIPAAANSKKTTPAVVGSSTDTKQYTDASGFKFNYQDDLVVAAGQTKDQSIYSSLNLTSNKNDGNIDIEVTNSSLKGVQDYLKKNKISISQEKIKKLKLGDLDAWQFEIDNKMTTLAFDQDTLFVITANPQKNKDYWSNINNKIVNSFEFVRPDNTGDNSVPDDNVTFEGEETVE